jgi:hypothetical protein
MKNKNKKNKTNIRFLIIDRFFFLDAKLGYCYFKKTCDGSVYSKIIEKKTK